MPSKAADLPHRTAVAPENVHLEVALATQRLVQQDTIDIISHVYAQIIHKDYYMQEEDDRILAFLERQGNLGRHCSEAR